MRKKLAAEFLGTFVIVLAPVLFAHHGMGLLAAALISGLPVMAMIYALGPISAAHFNPAVTLGFAVARRFPSRAVIPYLLAQLIGATAAAAVVYFLFQSGAGAHIPTDPAATVRNVGTEAVISFILMLVIIAVATDRRVSATIPGAAIGAAVIVGVLLGGPVTGGSMNPARSLGPALFVNGSLDHLWIYIAGPVVGAVLAALAYEAVRAEPQHAKGAPDDLSPSSSR